MVARVSSEQNNPCVSAELQRPIWEKPVLWCCKTVIDLSKAPFPSSLDKSLELILRVAKAVFAAFLLLPALLVYGVGRAFSVMTKDNKASADRNDTVPAPNDWSSDPASMDGDTDNDSIVVVDDRVNDATSLELDEVNDPTSTEWHQIDNEEIVEQSIIQVVEGLGDFETSSIGVSGIRSPNADQVANRIGLLSQKAGYNYFVRVRGDGNCFTNSLVAAFLVLSNKDAALKAKLFEVIDAESSAHAEYLFPDDTATAPHYSRDFTKDNDFALVRIKLTNDSIDELLQDNHFCAAFSRVLRQVLVAKDGQGLGLGLVSRKVGDNIDMMAVVLFNQLFNTKAVAVAVSGQRLQACESNQAYINYGQEIDFDQNSLINLEEDLDQTPAGVALKESDFALVYMSGHFILALKSL